ncbi:transketolase [Actinocrispum wychmicini]|uniref:Transketolase n=1 Tax=Actinocrispum wychmicini TaxID=1213861 RepID=A0A4R2JN51_9PSEU|nr:transketolase [Actinocrispum wychmicini]TCO55605.1 transketolase [Actinocrispum wychmicini]
MTTALASRVRRHIVEMAAGPEGAHVGGALSAADILTVLYFDVMRVRPEQPDWPDRDYFLLSKGHAAVGLYAVLAERGFFPVGELGGYAQAGSRLGGHPTRAVPGVELPTGSLGHGLSLGVGLALAAQRDGRDNRTFVLLGDGELQEGSVWEAAGSAAFLGLDTLTAIVDRNGLQISGSTARRTGLDLLATRWAGFGWDVSEVDGHDPSALADVLAERPADGKPRVVLADTVKGKGIPFLENRKKGHYVTFTPQARQRALAALG